MKKKTTDTMETEKPIRIRGASYLGRYLTILLTKDHFEVRALSTFLIVLVFVLLGLGFGALSLIWNNWIFTIASLILGGAFGYLLMTRYYNGKQLYYFAYGDIISFVSEPPDFTINLKDNRMITLRMMPKKQALLLEAIQTAMTVTDEYHVRKMGGYYKVRAQNQDIVGTKED